jgi:predicted permease
MARLLNFLPWRRRRKERDLDRELQYHVDRRADDLKRSGLSESEARRQAVLELGGIPQVQEQVRDMWLWRWLDHLTGDLRYARRTLSRNPIFTATAVLSLALGIGANAGIFSLVDQVLLRVLPVNEPERLVLLDWNGNSLSSKYGANNVLSYPFCRDLQQQKEFFDGVFCRYPTNVHLSTGQQQEPVRVELVSGSYFPVLGVQPEIGRLISESDDLQLGAHPVAVLSYTYWKNKFGGVPDVVGTRILINNYPITVIGIAPPAFRGVDLGEVPALWMPSTMAIQAQPEVGTRMLNRRAFWMHVFARVKPGSNAGEAQTALQPWFKSMLDSELQNEGFPPTTPEQRRAFLASTIAVDAAPRGWSYMRVALERPLWVLLSGTLLLLLLASLNVAGLLVARGAARNKELTTRMALGASRGRLTVQLLTESLLMTLAGGFLGLLIAPLVSQALLAFVSKNADLSSDLDPRVFLFAFSASILTGILCGLASALQTGRIALIAALKQRLQSATRGGVRLRKVLVAGQMALTLILLIGAGLFVQTLERLYAKGPGFASDHLVMFRVDPVSIGYPDTKAEQAMRDVLRKLHETPGVETAAVANTHMLTGGSSATHMTMQTEERIPTDRSVHYMRIGPGFFSTLGAQIVAGRDFDERDARLPGEKATEWRSVIVNETLARRYFGKRNPVGYRLGLGNRPNTVTNIEIIGVVKDFSRRTLRDGELEQAFFPFWANDSGDGTFYVKMRGKPESAFASIREAVGQVDGNLPLLSLTTFDDQLDQSLTTERAMATLSSGFGVIALLLSVVGLYGVMSFIVTQRTQEIGVRLALGATRSSVVWLTVRDALIMIAAGTAVALPCAWGLSRFVEGQLFGVRAVDGWTIVAACALLALVALGAATLPASRAASVNPTDALRLE